MSRKTPRLHELQLAPYVNDTLCAWGLSSRLPRVCDDRSTLPMWPCQRLPYKAQSPRNQGTLEKMQKMRAVLQRRRTISASIMASATPSAAVPGTRPAAPEERGAGGLRRHAEGPQVADAVIDAQFPRLLSARRLTTTCSYSLLRSTATPAASVQVAWCKSLLVTVQVGHGPWLRLGLREPLERPGAKTEQAHRAVPPHTPR